MGLLFFLLPAVGWNTMDIVLHDTAGKRREVILPP